MYVCMNECMYTYVRARAQNKNANAYMYIIVCIYPNFLTNIYEHLTSPLHESRLLWIHDAYRNQPSRVLASHPPAAQKTNPVPRTNTGTVPRTNPGTVPRTNTKTVPRINETVSKNRENGPRNGPIPGPAPRSSDARVRAPLDDVSSSVWYNSSLSSRDNNCLPVPRNNVTDRQTNVQKNASLPHKKKRINYKRRERRAREKRSK